LVVYVENPDKTENPKYYDKPDATERQTQELADVIEYAVNAQKTTLQAHDETTPAIKQFVSGINVSPITARDSMMRAKREFRKTDGVVAYHGYQSFAPGEATPEIAHEIGKKLAQQLWGDKYQVLVATHLDKSSHLHNHFIINTVSHIDGSKFHRTKRDYYDMQRASDALCREYGLSVIEEPERGRTKHYAEWDAERNGHPTWRGIVKADVDTAIRRSMTERQFFDNLSKMGYGVKVGMDISVRPPGKERFVRLHRNFGDDYAIEGIRRRILAQDRPERQIIPPDPPPKKVQFKGTFHKANRQTGLRALYLYYLYRMGALPKQREPSPKQVYFLFREDIRFVQRISQETRLLVKHGIDTGAQLTSHMEGLTAHLNSLCGQRKRLRNQMRSIRDEGRLAAVKEEVSGISNEITGLRREVKLCEEIETRSAEMRDKIRRAAENEKSTGREKTSHELCGRRR